MTQSLEAYVKRSSALDPTDFFGKGRIRKLIYEYDELKRKSSTTLSNYKEIMLAQAQCVTKVLMRNQELEKENSYLKHYIRESDLAKVNLQQKKVTAEQDKTTSDARNHELMDENLRLKDELARVKQDYNELSTIHDQVIQAIKDGAFNSQTILI